MTLHPQAAAALELWSVGPKVTDPGFGPKGIDAMRADARIAAASEPKEDVARIEAVDADGVRCRLYLPEGPEVAAPSVLVFLHGGGFVFGDVETHDAQSRRIANRTEMAVLAVDYRRPPEHHFPAAPDDVDTALAWLLSNGDRHGLDTTRCALVGDSAGANLALVASLRNTDAIGAAVLVYPFLDPGTGSASYAATDGGLTRDEARWFWSQYARTAADLTDPDLAPLKSTHSRFRGLQEPVLIQAAEHDVLLDENIELARRLEDAGVDVRLTTYPGMIHGFWRHPDMFDAAEASWAEMAAFLSEHV